MLHSRVQLSTLVLATVAIFDLATTILLLGRGFSEGNPIFRWLLALGPWAFVFGKAALLAGPILLLEYARTKKPALAESATWVAALLYLFLYISHILKLW
ncbi:MAG: hypothetical protein KJZ62_06835 [Fimbriimonadaceae bacterium]|nr:hypothetical protein [Fimbriimonadaceae bacterium]QOJ12570.1 MAG: hypothetical protein HRU74_11110 [Chthonomonadaceae bacterium]RIK01259.1 MAG: hypothetical protein DCC46_01520 [Armatimonadota bacterium]